MLFIAIVTLLLLYMSSYENGKYSLYLLLVISHCQKNSEMLAFLLLKDTKGFNDEDTNGDKGQINTY